MNIFSALLFASLFGIVNHVAGQTSIPNASATMAAGTYTIHKLASYTPNSKRTEVSMPKITPNGDTLSAIVVAQAQGVNLLKLNMTQYYNQTVQLSFWIGDLTMRPISHNVYDLYLGTTKMGRIENKRITLDFEKHSTSTKAGIQLNTTHFEGTKK